MSADDFKAQLDELFATADPYRASTMARAFIGGAAEGMLCTLSYSLADTRDEFRREARESYQTIKDMQAYAEAKFNEATGQKQDGVAA